MWKVSYDLYDFFIVLNVEYFITVLQKFKQDIITRQNISYKSNTSKEVELCNKLQGIQILKHHKNISFRDMVCTVL